MFPQSAPPKYHYFEVLLGLAWSRDSERYAGGSAGTVMASYARQVKSDNADKKGYPGLPVWDWDVGLTTQLNK
jgi:hypothetical protein